MVPAASEETRRFDSEVADLLFTPIEEAELIFRLRLVPLSFQLLLLRLRHGFLLRLLRLEMLKHRPEVAGF